jgi:hypothetical protein
MRKLLKDRLLELKSQENEFKKENIRKIIPDIDSLKQLCEEEWIYFRKHIYVISPTFYEFRLLNKLTNLIYVSNTNKLMGINNIIILNIDYAIEENREIRNILSTRKNMIINFDLNELR